MKVVHRSRERPAVIEHCAGQTKPLDGREGSVSARREDLLVDRRELDSSTFDREVLTYLPTEHSATNVAGQHTQAWFLLRSSAVTAAGRV